MDPVHRVWVASLTNHREALKRADIVLLDPFTVVVHLFDNAYACWGYIKTVNFVVLDSLPECAWVWGDRFAFIEDRTSSSQQRSIYDVMVSHNPADITASHVDFAFVDVENGAHVEV